MVAPSVGGGTPGRELQRSRGPLEGHDGVQKMNFVAVVCW